MEVTSSLYEYIVLYFMYILMRLNSLSSEPGGDGENYLRMHDVDTRVGALSIYFAKLLIFHRQRALRTILVSVVTNNSTRYVLSSYSIGRSRRTIQCESVETVTRKRRLRISRGGSSSQTAQRAILPRRVIFGDLYGGNPGPGRIKKNNLLK